MTLSRVPQISSKDGKPALGHRVIRRILIGIEPARIGWGLHAHDPDKSNHNIDKTHGRLLKNYAFKTGVVSLQRAFADHANGFDDHVFRGVHLMFEQRR
jgi:hypothetical protein